MEILTRDAIDYLVAGHSLHEIVNFNEHAVLKAMRRLYGHDTSLCRCSLCVEDTFALALNALPPRYIQATSLHTYEGSSQFIAEDKVRAAVEEAAGKVKARPNH
ncbi:MAG: late competence development ComFB family protein [Thermodesulfobacteriota bacterium]|jgi:competence protein ComFB